MTTETKTIVEVALIHPPSGVRNTPATYESAAGAWRLIGGGTQYLDAIRKLGPEAASQARANVERFGFTAPIEIGGYRFTFREAA